MPNPPRHSSSISIHRAFVIHLQADSDMRHGLLAGRVEHVVSGQVSRFHSLDELLAFMAQILTQVADHSTSSCPCSDNPKRAGSGKIGK